MEPAELLLNPRQTALIKPFRAAYPETAEQTNRLSVERATSYAIKKNIAKRTPKFSPVMPPEAKRANSSLPAYKDRETILETIASNDITIVTGETGCGKTTQVPQYLLEEARASGTPVSIIVAQPRRIAATAVAKRVAEERGERLGDTVGFHIRFGSRYSPKTALLFCTSGILLKTMINGKEALQNLTHVILDEVHERRLDSDLILAVITRQLAEFPSLKVILMSATLSGQVNLFKRHFSKFKVGECNISCRTFNVKEWHLEDILHRTQYAPSLVAKAAKEPAPAARQVEELLDLYAKKRGKSERVDVDLLVYLVRFLVPTALGQGSILVFLPGMDAINSVRGRLERECAAGLLILTLHSQMHDDAVSELLFNPAPPNTVKVILSTNIAEASITIEDVVMVVDSGRTKVKKYNAATESTSLEEQWASKSSAKQRKGRAGRCQDGAVFRLYSRRQFDDMEETDVPEILRVSIFEACLKARQFFSPQRRRIPASALLKAAPEPPTDAAITHSISFLWTIDALHANADNASVTELGSFMMAVSLDPKQAVTLINAVGLRCLDPVLSIIAAVSSADPFIELEGKDQAALILKKRVEASIGYYSDHYTLFRVVNLYEKVSGLEDKKLFCIDNGLNFHTMEMIAKTKCELIWGLERLGVINELEEGLSWRALNKNANSWAMLKAAIAAGAYPFFALISDLDDDDPIKPIFCQNRYEDCIRTSGKSTLAAQKPPVALGQVFLAYEELKRGPKSTYAETLTMVPSLTLAIFAGQARVPNSARTTVAGRTTWDLGQLKISAPEKDADLVWFLRRKWKHALLRKLADLTAAPTDEEYDLVQLLGHLLQAEDKLAKLDWPPEFGPF